MMSFAKELLICAVLLLAASVVRSEEPVECRPRSIKIVFFLPADLAIPPGVEHRLTRIADAADQFLLEGMRQHGYPAGVKTLFERDEAGQARVLQVRGEEPAASGKYSQPDCIGYVISKAAAQYEVARASHVWWVFIYLGDRPTRFERWFGRGNPRDGGFAVVNYDTVPGDIRPNLQLTEGFNFEYKLKSTIHELAHGFGLPHMGPDLSLNLGNSLMGPNPPGYAMRKGPKSDHVYLAAAEAAMLWKHPLFTGKTMPRYEPWDAQLTGCKAVFDRAADKVTVTGKLVSAQPAHSVVLIDDRGDRNPDAEYWSRSYSARIGNDGSFKIELSHPAHADGEFRLLFCFDNGIVSGNGKAVGFENRGDIRKKYRYLDGDFHFEE